METTIALVVLVAVVALLMRMFSKPEETRMPGDEAEAGGQEVEELLEEADAAAAEDAVAITSDGVAFLPHRDSVHLIPPGEEDEALSGLQVHVDPEQLPKNPRTGKRMVRWRPGEHLDPGDLVAARMVRGAPDHDPWRLEALGRDRDYRAWRFETGEAARAALELLERRIVRAPLGEDDEPVRFGPEDFAAAEREQEEIERELANLPEEEEEPGRPASAPDRPSNREEGRGERPR